MKKRVFVLVSLVVAVLIGVGNVFAQDGTSNIPNPPLGPEWKLVFRISFIGTVYVNTRKITYSPRGNAKVWFLWVPRGNWREDMATDVNNAKRLRYVILLDKFFCNTNQSVTLKITDYYFGQAGLFHESVQNEVWKNIPPGTAGVGKYVCNEKPVPQSIPEPSLSSNWKILDIQADGTTFYVNTRKISYLPEGIVKVWTLWVPRTETRRGDVNIFKHNLLSEGKDPNNAERFWYLIELDKLNCKTHQDAELEDIYYSFGKAVLDDESFQHEKWYYIPPGTAIGEIEKYVCKEHKEEK